jgi:predicted methyltransferase
MIRATFAALMIAASSAMAQECAPTEQVHDYLTHQFGEAQVFVGITPDGQGVVEMWGGPDSWTVVISNAETGVSCLAASGYEWGAVPQGEDM